MTQTVVHYTDSSVFGGAEQVLLHILSNLDRRQWRPVLFHHPEPGIAPLLEKARQLNITMRTVPKIPGLRHIGRLPQFVQALRAEQTVVFHAHLTGPIACKYGTVAAALARVPAKVVTAHLCWDLPPERSIYIQPRLVATGVDRYIAVSSAVVSQLKKPFGIPTSKIRLVHNGIPLEDFRRSDDKSSQNEPLISTNQPVILTIARLDKQKGHSYLLEAALQVPEATFVLVGDGPERASLEAKAQELGLGDRVIFLGYRDDVPDLLAGCDLFVLPSLYEGLPLSILEAMAAGKPVIASTVGGNNEVVVHGETGLLVPAANPAALVGAIRLILSDAALAQRLGAAGKARVYQEFSVETMVRSVSKIYDEVLDRTKTVSIHPQQSLKEL